MKTSLKCSLIAAALVATSGVAMAAPVTPYVANSTGSIVMDPFGLCWRTGFWTPALAEQAGVEGAGCTCDKDILSAGACQKAAPAPEAQSAKVTLSADTLFAFDSDNLSAEGQLALDDLVSRMAGMDVEVILATGYTDRLGSESYNQKLSEARAQAVKDYLGTKGVAADSVQTEGRGAAEAVADCADVKGKKELVECLAPNRRAVIEVIGTRSAQ